MLLVSRDSLIASIKATKMNWLFFCMWGVPMAFCSGAKKN